MAYKQYSAKEKKAYFNQQSKVGAVDKNGKLLSDFLRGMYKAKADAIHNAQVKCAKRYKKNENDPTMVDWLND